MYTLQSTKTGSRCQCGQRHWPEPTARRRLRRSEQTCTVPAGQRRQSGRAGWERANAIESRAGQGLVRGLLDPFRPHKCTAELLRNLGAVASCLTLPRNTRLARGHCPHLSIYFISVLKILGIKGWHEIFPPGHIDLFGRPDQKIDSPL